MPAVRRTAHFLVIKCDTKRVKHVNKSQLLFAGAVDRDCSSHVQFDCLLTFVVQY